MSFFPHILFSWHDSFVSFDSLDSSIFRVFCTWFIPLRTSTHSAHLSHFIHYIHVMCCIQLSQWFCSVLHSIFCIWFFPVLWWDCSCMVFHSFDSFHSHFPPLHQCGFIHVPHSCSSHNAVRSFHAHTHDFRSFAHFRSIFPQSVRWIIRPMNQTVCVCQPFSKSWNQPANAAFIH